MSVRCSPCAAEKISTNRSDAMLKRRSTSMSASRSPVPSTRTSGCRSRRMLPRYLHHRDTHPWSLIVERLYAVLTGRPPAWAVLALAVLASALVLAFRGTAPSDNDPTGDLPAAAESTQVAELQRQLPSGQTNPALVVYSRDGQPLTAADEAAIRADAAALREVALGGQLPPPVFAPDRRGPPVSVPPPATSSSEDVAAAVDRIRAEARAGLPGGLTAQVTGGAGFLADISAAFDGADVSLLGVTVAVVALLLLVTYRSPWLWLVPLTVIGLADQVALALVTILAR